MGPQRQWKKVDQRSVIKVVGVVGAGTMGNGIAQVFAQAGFTVRLVDIGQPLLDRARTNIDKRVACICVH